MRALPRKKALRICLDHEAYRPGETVRGRVEVDWPASVPVRGVRVGFLAAETTSIRVSSGSGKNQRTITYAERRPLVEEERILFGGSGVGWLRASSDLLGGLFGLESYPVLRAGRYRYPFSFPLPEDAPTSFDGTYAKVEYEIHAVVDVPAGLDLTYRGEVPVLPPSGTRLAALKGRAESSGMLKADVDMRVRLEPCALEAGTRLQGRLEVSNRSSKRIRGVTFRLVGVEQARAEGLEREDRHVLNKGYLRSPDPASGVQDVTFSIPVNGPFPYEGEYSRLEYRLEWSLDTAMGFDTTVEVPLEVARP